MATAIRLKRGGRTHEPYYRIVVIDSRARNRGPEVDIIGIYHPCARPKPVSEVDAHKALHWLRQGAQPTDTARSVLSKLGVMKHFHEGTTPEENVAVAQGQEVEVKGYNAPPPPKPEAPKEAEPTAPAEAEAEVASEPAEAGEATAEAGEATPEAEASAAPAEAASEENK